MSFSLDTFLLQKNLCRGTSDRVWRSATELRASLTNSDGGGIRTHDLPINSRSNPCLHHRQLFILVAALQTARQRSRQQSFDCACDRRLGAQAGLAASSKFLPGNKAIQAQGALPLSYVRHLRTATSAGFEPATSRLIGEVSQIYATGKVDLKFCRDAACCVSTEALCEQPTLEARFQTGNNRPGVVVRRSRFETTALEMPAGFGRIHHRANLARDGWPGPHLRTGDVTLVFTTDETRSNVLNCCFGSRVLTNPAHVLGEPLQSGNKRQERASVCVCPGCLVIRGYASAAEGTLIRQSSNSALHLVGGSISRHPPPTDS